MVIVEPEYTKQWIVMNAEEFCKEFGIEKAFDYEETDEEYIYEHLEKDKRKFSIEFFESPTGNAYEEYWRIREESK